MLINSVIIILREVLEAALIISIFLALSQTIQLSKHWLIIGSLLGAIGAIFYAVNIQIISMAWGGIGQEIVNASLHFLNYLGIISFIILFRNDNTKYISSIIAICIALAFTREGSEILIYIDGLISLPAMRSPVLLGGFIGMGIGFSVGVFCYYFIVNLSARRGLKIALFLLVLISCGMILQVTQLLLQADIINSQQALWNSSAFISEQSVLGQLLYALIGYEATPTPIQVYSYLFSLLLMTFLVVKTASHLKEREQI